MLGVIIGALRGGSIFQGTFNVVAIVIKQSFRSPEIGGGISELIFDILNDGQLCRGAINPIMSKACSRCLRTNAIPSMITWLEIL